MQHSEQIALIERALSHLDNRTTDRGEGFKVPADLYTSPDQLQREKSTLFQAFPLVAGFSSQAQNPGDFFVFEFCEKSIVVVRDLDRRLHAFANFCRHRGTQLVLGSGNAKKFVCPYHSWSYGMDGRLLAAPHAENFLNLDERGLKSYPVGEKYGLVWVKPALDGRLDLDRELGVLSRDLESFGFDSHVHFASRTFLSPINWKLMLEGSLETYHFKHVHKKTIAPMFFDDLGVFDWRSPHGRLFLPKQNIKDLKNTPKENWDIRGVGNIIYFFFPNTILLVQPDHATWMSSYPTSERESLVHGGTLIPPEPLDERSSKYWQKNVDIFWQAIDEDYAMSERIQLGLNSGTVDELLFGSTEYFVRHLYDEIKRALGSSR